MALAVVADLAEAPREHRKEGSAIQAAANFMRALDLTDRAKSSHDRTTAPGRVRGGNPAELSPEPAEPSR